MIERIWTDRDRAGPMRARFYKAYADKDMDKYAEMVDESVLAGRGAAAGAEYAVSRMRREATNRFRYAASTTDVEMVESEEPVAAPMSAPQEEVATAPAEEAVAPAEQLPWL